MECPKCYGTMDTVLEGETTIDRCQNCRGLYFDQLTQALLEPIKAQALSIDSAEQDSESGFDDMVYVECPKCDKPMVTSYGVAASRWLRLFVQ